MTSEDARFVTLYERHYRDVYGYCRRRTAADRVDDAVADTFLTAWRNITDVPEGTDALPWLYSVAYRVLGHQWRSASRRAKLHSRLDSLGVTHAVAPEELLVLDQESRLVLDALSRLKPADQELLRLTVWEELRHKEIARVLGISVDAVKKRASRARKALAREVERSERRQESSPAAQKGGTW
jgi:RNA polymerase sigma factor (sigma-70 family)